MGANNILEVLGENPDRWFSSGEIACILRERGLFFNNFYARLKSLRLRGLVDWRLFEGYFNKFEYRVKKG